MSLFLLFPYFLFFQQELLETRIAELEDALLRLQDQFNKVSIHKRITVIYHNLIFFFLFFPLLLNHLCSLKNESFTHFIGRLLTKRYEQHSG